MLKDIKYTGLNTVSNGYDATAGQLAIAHNVINERGYVEPLASTDVAVDYSDHYLMGCECLYKHEMLSGVTNYIFYMPAGDFNIDYGPQDDPDFRIDEQATLVFLDKNAGPGTAPTEVTWQPGSPVKTSITTPGNIYEITAVGNTLCVLTAAGMDYFVWKNNGYTELGTTIPTVKIRFGLGLNDYYADDITSYTTTSESELTREILDSFDEPFKAWVNKNTHEARLSGEFVYPFLVRYALRLYDGSLVHHSAPVLMTTHDICAPFMTIEAYQPQPGFRNFFPKATLVSGTLMMKLGNQIPEGWRDVVTGVEVYASAPLQKFMEEEKPKTWHEISWEEVPQDSGDYYWEDDLGGECVGSLSMSEINHRVYELRNVCADIAKFSHAGTGLMKGWWIEYPSRKIDVKDVGLFYKIAEFKAYTTTNAWLTLDVGDLNNLVTKEVMTDDYYSHETLIPKGAYAYNQRLNIFDITRKISVPFNPAIYLQHVDGTSASSSDKTINLAVQLRDESGERWIGCQLTEAMQNNGNTYTNIRYLFVPVRNAVSAILYFNNASNGYHLTLTPHNSLNGSVWFGDFQKAVTSSGVHSFDTFVTEETPNKIYTSEVGNPFYFPIGGINTIGTGKILSLASNVRAISQGQFGEYPLYVFTDTGIWMLEVDDKGLYKAKQPMSLDVIKPGSKVTSVDNAVAYVIERGLMLVSGSETKCISEVLDGMYDNALPDTLGGFLPPLVDGADVTWDKYKEKLACAYDSVHFRLHAYNPDYKYHYVYSLRTGLWSTEDNYKEHFTTYKMLSTINGNYVNTERGLLDVTLVGNTSRMQTILTRPISFETDAYKRLRDNIQRGDIDLLRVGNTRNISVLLQATDDLLNWHDIAAVTRHYRIIRKSGTPHKWFRWKIVIGSSPEEYRLHGLTADVEVTGNNKLR